jgi:hypothetical protein
MKKAAILMVIRIVFGKSIIDNNLIDTIAGRISTRK